MVGVLGIFYPTIKRITDKPLFIPSLPINSAPLSGARFFFVDNSSG